MRLHERLWTAAQLVVGVVAAIGGAVQGQWAVAGVGLFLIVSCWVTNARLGTWVGRGVRRLKER